MSINKITVLLDTNVFVAAYWSRKSASARLIKACIDGIIQAQYTPEVKAEVSHILRMIKVSTDYLEMLDAFWAQAIEIKSVAVDSIYIEDPDDRKYLEAAAGGETDFLVTNDDHLLRVGYVGRAEIITPGSVVRILHV